MFSTNVVRIFIISDSDCDLISIVRIQVRLAEDIDKVMRFRAI